MLPVCSGPAPGSPLLNRSTPQCLSCKRDKETNFTCYLIFPTADKDQIGLCPKCIVFGDVARLRSCTQKVGRVRVKTNGRSVKVNDHHPASGGVNYARVKFVNPHVFWSSIFRIGQERKATVAARCVNTKT